MIKITISKKLKRVNKTTARKLHKQGVKLYVLPCKVRIHNMWIFPSELTNEFDFDTFVNQYIYYNCNYELGYYPSFYIKEED